MKPLLLIVDDEKSTRTVLSAALEDDYEVYAAANGKAARAILESEPVDLLLTDLRLGGESGMDIIDFAVGLPQPPLCIMMTAYGSADVAAEAKRHGAYYFLTKPLNLDEVELLLRRATHTRQLETENRELTTRLEPTGGLDRMLGDSPQMQDIFNRIRRVAPSQATVLIEGESGTGKELVARALHSLSPRSKKKFVAVNCAALSPQLMESELFGHEKGAFTGAMQRRIGRFEEADGGTLFLDEIGEIDIPTQVKLLRVLAERSIERVGSNTSIPVNVRVIAATNRNLAEMVEAGTFRLDLYQRINVISLSRPALELLRSYGWPGNVRQLRTAVEHGVVMCSGSEIHPEDLPDYLLHPSPTPNADTAKRGSADFELETAPSLNLQCLERRAILLALQRTGGNRSAAAELLGIKRRTLQRKMAEAPDTYKDFIS